MTAEAAMEAMRPDTEPEVSANRLRTVLNRLRESAGDVGHCRRLDGHG
jgi:hypothetical protein